MKKKQQKDKLIIFLIIIFILQIGLLLFDNWAESQPFTQTMAYILGSKLVISGVILFFTWIIKNKPPLLERIILTVFSVNHGLFIYLIHTVFYCL